MTASDYEERLARQLFSQHRYDEAESAFRLALAKKPGDAELLLALAQCIDVEERADEALSLFREAAKNDPMLADAHNGVGICESDLESAEAAFRSALSMDPSSSEFHANLAVCLMRQGRLEDAEPCLRRAVTLAPHELALVADWGELLLELGRTRDCAAAMRRHLGATTARHRLLEARIWGLYERRDWDRAERMFQQQRGTATGAEGWLHYVLGRALLEQDDLAGATDSLRIAVGLLPGESAFHRSLGRALEMARKPDAAGAAYARAKELARRAR